MSVLATMSDTSLSRTLCRASRSQRERQGAESLVEPFKNMKDRRNRGR
jgi:hypothetical protein